MAIDAGDLRVHYDRDELLESNSPEQPMPLFERWFEDARKSDSLEPNAMCLATLQADGSPAARIVLLKEVVADGFIFYTNYRSHKGQQLAQDPQVAAVFNWLELQRQVRIEGRVEKVSSEKSTQYFHTRPIKSQLGAIVSQQSSIISGREVLESEMEQLLEQYGDQATAPKPEHWGGYLIRPQRIEFWQGRQSRLHDRLVYELKETGEWSLVRLAP